MAELSSRKLELLKLIAEYRVLLTAQVALLSGTGQRAAEKTTQMLRDRGYLTFSHYELEGNRGRPKGVCSLTDKGAELLKREGLIISEIPNHRMTGEEIVHVSHELLINWFRIHLLQIDNHIPDLHTEFISATTPFQPLNEDGLPMIADRVSGNDADDGFIPDGVFCIRNEQQNKRLLFFLEVDRSTESIASAQNPVSISQKIRSYRSYFQTKGYKRYEKMWMEDLDGFRVLFLTNTPQRKESICGFLRTNPSLNFIWITDKEQMFRHGISASIWVKGGPSSPLVSILGPTLAQELPLPLL
ncbi:replication-relaxation family protein [candidate division KSB1 bacterium]|nr:replication-relaxation family protein [candidate division KSB1 bacterium]